MENIIYNELLRRGYNVDVGVVEVRSFLGTRGDIVKTLLHQYHEKNKKDPDFVFCMGDSSIDEYMFQ